MNDSRLSVFMLDAAMLNVVAPSAVPTLKPSLMSSMGRLIGSNGFNDKFYKTYFFFWVEWSPYNWLLGTIDTVEAL